MIRQRAPAVREPSHTHKDPVHTSTVRSPPPPASRSFLCLRASRTARTLSPVHSLGADTHWHPTHIYIALGVGDGNRGAQDLSLYPTLHSIGNRPTSPSSAPPNPPGCRTPHLSTPSSLRLETAKLPPPRRKRWGWSPRSQIPASLQSSGKGSQGGGGGHPDSCAPIIPFGGTSSSSSGRMGRRAQVSHLSPLPFSQSQPTLTHPSFPPSAARSLPANLPQRQRSGGRTKGKAWGEAALGGAGARCLSTAGLSS